MKNVDIKLFFLRNFKLLFLLIELNVHGQTNAPFNIDSITPEVSEALSDAIFMKKVNNLTGEEKKLYNSNYFSIGLNAPDKMGKEFFLSKKISISHINEYRLIIDSIAQYKTNLSIFIYSVTLRKIRFTNTPYYQSSINNNTKYDTITIDEFSGNGEMRNDKFYLLKNINTSSSQLYKWYVLCGNADIKPKEILSNYYNRKTKLINRKGAYFFGRMISINLGTEDRFYETDSLVYDTNRYYGFRVRAKQTNANFLLMQVPKNIDSLSFNGITMHYYSSDTLLCKMKNTGLSKITYYVNLNSNTYLTPEIQCFNSKEQFKTEWKTKKIGDIYTSKEYLRNHEVINKKNKNKSKDRNKSK